MIKSTDEYKRAIVADSRQILLKATVDISDPNLVYGDAAASPQAKYSSLDRLHDKDFSIKNYATLEPNRWKLDGSMSIYPDSGGDYNFLSQMVSDENGVFSPAQFVELRFSGVKVLQACSVYFSNNKVDGVPEDFSISILQGGVERYKHEFKGNKSTTAAISGFTVNNADAIRLTVRKTSIPRRRLRVVEIIAGIFEEWTGDNMASFALKHQGNIGNTAVPYGTCSIVMDNLSRRFEPRNKTGVFKSVTEQQSIYIMMGVVLPDGSPEYKPLGVFYQHGEGWKTSNNDITMQWDLVDILGLLADREYITPDVLPTTLEGWVKSITGQLGINFENRYIVDPNYKNAPVTATKEKINGMTCGDLIRYIAMASGTWARADSETGFLTFEPLWNQGNKITLDNLVCYPTMRANRDIAAVIFDVGGEKIAISGNSTSASDTISVNNPFLHNREDAIKAARLILSTAGGNQIDIIGRGDMTSEIGDVDTIWLDESNATTARRIMQDFSLSDGVLQNVSSTLIQSDGAFIYESRVFITKSGTWKAPAGVRQLRIILVGKGQDGTDGTDGTWESAGIDGTDGAGGKVYSEIIDINDQQEFTISIGNETVFGAYTSASGEHFPYGYTDIQNGDSFARTGVVKPISGYGDGGKGGKGGAKGNKHEERDYTVGGTLPEGNGNVYLPVTVIDNYPGAGGKGSLGVFGCVVIYYSK